MFGNRSVDKNLYYRIAFLVVKKNLAIQETSNTTQSDNFSFVNKLHLEKRSFLDYNTIVERSFGRMFSS